LTEASKKVRIADAHTHIFPQKIAVKASNAIGKFYDIPMEYDGMTESLLSAGKKIGVGKYLVCSSATTPAQVMSINNFIFEQCNAHSEFMGFGTLHAYMEEPDKEIDRILEMGLKGIKLHPDFQLFDIDDEKAIPIYRRLTKEKLIVLFHTGDKRYEYSSPQKLRRVVDMIPDFVCIGAHFGGYNRWEDARIFSNHPNIYYDTSSALFKLPADEAVDIINEFGEDRFMFGTDYPMWDHEDELERFNTMKLTPAQREKIFYKNFEKLFGVEVPEIALP